MTSNMDVSDNRGFKQVRHLLVETGTIKGWEPQLILLYSIM